MEMFNEVIVIDASKGEVHCREEFFALQSAKRVKEAQ